MVALPQTYKVADLPEGQDFEPIPAGEYSALIVGSQRKDNKAGTGWFLELEIDITAGQYKGRKLFERLNLENPNPQAVEISFQTLGKICRAFGLETVGDSTQLHNRPINIVVDIKESTYEKDGEQRVSRQNNIKKWLPFSQGPSPAQAAAPKSGNDGGAASSSAPPWAK